MNRYLDFVLRPDMRRSDTVWLVIALIVGGGAGLLLGAKVSPYVGIPFAVVATAFLHFTWRFQAVRKS